MPTPQTRASRPLSSLLALVRAQAGNITILGAGAFLVLSGVFSLSLDVGILYTTKRELQTAADMAALKAVTYPTDAETLVADVLEANSISGELDEDPGVSWGRFPPVGYTMDNVGSLPVEDRFQAGAAGANALRVTLSESPRLYLINLFSDEAVRVSAEAIAANFPVSQLVVGSEALGFDSDKATAFNSILSSLLGTSVGLSAAGYNGLAAADIRILGFLDALAAGASISAGDYNAVLAEEFTFPEIVAAVLAAIGADEDFSGDTAVVTAVLQQLSSDLADASPAPLGDVISLDADNPKNGGSARLNLLDLVMASGEAANAEHGTTAEVSVPLAGGLASLRVAAVEPRRFSAIGGPGITAATGQARVYLVVEPTQALSLAGVDFDLRFPLLIETTKGVGTVTAISCPTHVSADGTVSVTATAGTLKTSVVDIDPAQLGQDAAPVTQPAEIVDGAGLLRVTATGEVTYGSGSGDLAFVAPFTADNIQRVSTSDPVGDAGTALFEDLTYDVEVLGLPLISEATVVSGIEPIADAVAPEVDALLASVLEALGASAGNTDVAIPYINCRNPVLIQ